MRTRQYLYLEYDQSRWEPELFDVQALSESPVNVLKTPERQQALPELKRLLKKYRREKNHG